MFDSLNVMQRVNNDRFAKALCRTARSCSNKSSIWRKTFSSLRHETESMNRRKEVDFKMVQSKLAKTGTDFDILSEHEIEKLKNGSKK